MVRFGRGRGTQQDNNGHSGSGTSSKTSPTTKILTLLSALLIPLWLLAGGAWIVQVVGLAFCQHTVGGNGSHFLQFDWFVTAITLVTLLLLPWSLIARRASVGLVALLAIVTVLEILRTNVWNNARLAQGSSLTGGSGTQIDSVVNPGLNQSKKRVDTVFAGYLMVSAFNLMLLLGLGALPAPSAQDAHEVEHHARNAADQHKSSDYNGNTGNTGPTGNTGNNGHNGPTSGNMNPPGVHSHMTQPNNTNNANMYNSSGVRNAADRV
ncbi:hypothetical protein WJX73_001400 [Symbiochloris irregularis]|uniref:Uncharacterized protein n=1 Tax=Symbiochloris irregularis TaxID=706552 RepID=A0AAW1NR56_9CHLO